MNKFKSALSLLRKHKFLTIIVAVFLFIVINKALNSRFTNPIIVSDIVNSSPVTGEKGVARVTESGWTVPVKLGFNDIGWEDSSYITRDGEHILIFYHPTTSQFDEVAKEATGVDDGRIYYSKRPFLTKELYPISKPGWPSEGGPYISLSNDFYYMRTFFFGKRLKVVKNKEVLDLKTEGDEGDPHYCDAKNELYFDAPGAQKIAVNKDGVTTYLPESINKPNTRNFQAFLTDDCETLYFTSTRGSWKGILPFQVYKSTRLGEFSWSEPKLFLKFPELGGVGEFTMTRDGKQAVFTQMAQDKDGVFRNNIYYVEKLK
jgi:hypothetical protein